MADTVEPRLSRGLRDLLSDQMLARQWMIDTIRGVYELYGFVPLGTPAIEYLDVLRGSSAGAETQQSIFRVTNPEREEPQVLEKGKWYWPQRDVIAYRVMVFFRVGKSTNNRSWPFVMKWFDPYGRMAILPSRCVGPTRAISPRARPCAPARSGSSHSATAPRCSSCRR